MKNYRRKVATTLLLLLVAVLSLSGVTYAWFSQNSTVESNEMQIKITDATSGISIATSINGPFLKTVNLGYIDSSSTYKPVSTDCIASGATGSKALTFYEATLSDGNADYITSATKVTSGYIQVDFWVKLEGVEPKDIQINASDLKNLFKTNSDSLKALRFAFINQGYCASVGSAGTLTDPNLVNSSAVTVFEPLASKHIDSVDSNVKQTTYGINQEFSNSNGVLINSDSEYVSSVATIDNGYETAFVAMNGFNKISLYIWYEGQDIDCLADIGGKLNSFTLNLRIKPTVVSS